MHNKIQKCDFGVIGLPVTIVVFGFLLFDQVVVGQNSTWQKLPDMPVGKWEAGTVVLDEKLYFFGGTP